MGLADVIKTIVEYLKGQPFSNVVALIQTAIIAGGIWVAVNQLIPSERAAILEGILSQEKQQTTQVDRVCLSFEKALDRMERQTSEGHHTDSGADRDVAGRTSGNP